MRTGGWGAGVVWMLLFGVCVANAETVALIEGEMKLEYGAEAEYTFRPPADSRSVALRISTRMDFPSAAGSTYVMRLTLNGEVITPEIDRQASRLLNKSGNFEMASGLHLSWFGYPNWRVVYSPDFETVQSEKAASSKVLGCDPYKLVLDVTDFVTRGEENTLQIEHLGKAVNLRQHFDGEPSLDFYIRELSVEFSEKEAVSKSESRAESRPGPDTLMVDPPQPADVGKSCTVDKEGALKIVLPGAELKLTTRLSYPGGGYNCIGGPAEAGAEPGFNVKTSGSGNEWRIMAEGEAYRLERTVRLTEDHVEVRDVLTNLRDQVTGIKYDNHLQAPAGSVVDAFLGGDSSPAKTAATGWENSSLYLGLETCGCGMVALDDVYRHQGIIYYEKDGGGIRSIHFGLAAGASYTVKFNVYPTLRAGYWDMISLARRDMDVNFTIPGGFSFYGSRTLLQQSKEELGEWMRLRGVEILSSGVWFDHDKAAEVRCYHGTHMLKAAKLRAQLKEGVARLRELFPDKKMLVYIHSFINTDVTAAERYPDARIMTAEGEHYINAGYTKRIGIPFSYFYMAPGNGYLEAMKEVVDMCLDEDKIHAHGIYWDEMAWISSRYTYDKWDGHSVDMDEKGEVTRKFGYSGLISLEAKRQLAEYILERGMLIGNSCPTSETMTKLHFPRFAETAAGWYPARTHLYTPISLGDHKTVKDWKTLLEDIRRKLDVGTVYYYYSRPEQPAPTVTEHMFPFTPVELHAGWLLGKKRIVTRLSGTYTFGDDDGVTVYCYGNEGPTDGRGVSETVKDGRRLVRLELGEDEMAVIVQSDAEAGQGEQ